MAKNYKEFDIQRPGFTDGIKIKIYKTPESMIKGYLAEWGKFNGRKKNHDDLSDSVGLFYTINRMISDKIDGRYTCDVCGIMFLNEKILTPEIAIHECAHVAFTHEKNIERFNMNYAKDWAKTHEERFAYYLGGLSSTVLDLLKKESYLR